MERCYISHICFRICIYSPGQGIWPWQGDPMELSMKGGDWYLLLRVFDCYCRGLISGGETWRWAMSPPRFGVFPIFSNFVGNSSGDSMLSLLTRYQVSFYLWPRGPVLKHCKVPKCYDQDCRSVNYMIDFSLSFSFSLQLIT